MPINIDTFKECTIQRLGLYGEALGALDAIIGTKLPKQYVYLAVHLDHTATTVGPAKFKVGQHSLSEPVERNKQLERCDMTMIWHLEVVDSRQVEKNALKILRKQFDQLLSQGRPIGESPKITHTTRVHYGHFIQMCM